MRIGIAGPSQAQGLRRRGRAGLIGLLVAVLTGSAAFAAQPSAADPAQDDAATPAVRPALGLNGKAVGADCPVAGQPCAATQPPRPTPAPPRPTLEEALGAVWRKVHDWALGGRAATVAQAATLVIEGVSAQPVVQDGHAALSVSGVIRNLAPSPQTAPALRVSLLNSQGRRVWSKRVTPAQSLVPAQAARAFNFAILDPPAAADQLEVIFDPGRRAGAPARPTPTSP
ncbi:DUF3426 domain-containing protein [Phenylobacterium aquaticum]|nr:DUF3426 domain-containing protein [Phenylobacterium aquaticum]MCI3132702.1 DUF3426 domain-containing protein [Phenylobacterium aquaticum]